MAVTICRLSIQSRAVIGHVINTIRCLKMEIRRWHCYIIINCVVIIPYLAAKPFSLNEAIAAEEQQKKQLDASSLPKSLGTSAERFSLNKVLRSNPLKTKKLKLTESLIPRGKKISSLKYRKSFQIKSPLKPKKLKYAKRRRLKRKNQFMRQEISGNERFNQKYIPLLRSIGMLFDNLLTSDDGESREIRRNKLKLTRQGSNIRERNGIVCKCSSKSDVETAESKPTEETIAPTTVIPAEVTLDNKSIETEAPTTSTYNTSTGYVSPLRQHQDIPLLSARDTHSTRRNDLGFSEGSRPTFHRSLEGDITRNNRNSEYNTKCRENGSSTTNDEKDSDSYTRDDASCDRFAGRIRGNGDDTRSTIVGRTIDGEEIDQTEELTKHETIGHFRAEFDELERDNQLKTGRDETESTTSVPKFIRGDRRFLYEEDTAHNVAAYIQSKEVGQESIFYVANNITRDKRIPDRDGANTEEDKTTSRTNEAMISNKDLSNPDIMLQSFSKTKAPFVTIIDGYSVALDKNGKNKLSEKSIHYYS